MLSRFHGRSESVDSDCGGEAAVVSPDLISVPFLVAGKRKEKYEFEFSKLVLRAGFKYYF